MLVAQLAQAHVTHGRLARIRPKTLLRLIMGSQGLDGCVVQARFVQPPREVSAPDLAGHAQGAGAHGDIDLLSKLCQLDGDLRAWFGVQGAGIRAQGSGF